MKKETHMMAKWICPCGCTLLRERYHEGIPEHTGCGDLTYLEDVEVPL